MFSIMLMTDFYYKYKVQLNKCTLHTKEKTYREYLTPKFLALTPLTDTCSRAMQELPAFFEQTVKAGT
jgi:hypothetical protein